MIPTMSKSLPLSCKEYYSQRNYTVYQQAVFLAILNQHYELVLKQSSKRSVVTSQLVRVIKIGNINDTISVSSFIENRCMEKIEIDRLNGLNEKTIYRRFSRNKIVETHNLLVDLIREFGVTFESEVGRVISNYFEETVHDTQSSVIPINDQTLQSFL
ncbi:TATA-binding protein-associated phosphoprotein [Entamoeba marina]